MIMHFLPPSSVIRHTAALGMAVVALVTGPGISRADQQQSLATAIATAELPAPAESTTLAVLDAATAIPDDLLGNESAMARIDLGPIVINDQEVNGVVQGNVATGNTTGNNSIADGAFAGAAGFTTAIQNTGNNVLIQNSTIINVSLDP